MKTIKIGNRILGEGHPTLISMEAGATHTGLNTAKLLAKAVADGGADAIKFQTINADELMSDRSQEISFVSASGEKRKELVYDALKRRELTMSQWQELKQYCDDLGLLFISTPTSEQCVDLLVKIGAHAIKVAKSDINHFHLVEHIAKTGLPIILDGRERFEDVATCVEICERYNVEDIVIMHCPSGYPAEHSGIHLSSISPIREIFKYPVGYSDHSVGTIMNYVAIGLGVNMIEKTVTLDKHTDAVEHSMSLEPQEIAPFVKNVRDIEQALGDPRVIFSSRVKAEYRRSIFAVKDLPAGHIIKLEDIAFRRPGTFFSAQDYKKMVGCTISKGIEAGAPITRNEIQEDLP